MLPTNHKISHSLFPTSSARLVEAPSAAAAGHFFQGTQLPRRGQPVARVHPRKETVHVETQDEWRGHKPYKQTLSLLVRYCLYIAFNSLLQLEQVLICKVNKYNQYSKVLCHRQGPPEHAFCLWQIPHTSPTLLLLQSWLPPWLPPPAACLPL